MAEPADQTQPSAARRALSGGVLLAVGCAVLAFAWGYPVGTVAQMGPGFIPRTVGVLIICLALAIILVDLTTPERDGDGTMHWRGLIFVSAAIVLFAVLIERAGLIPSMFLAFAVSMFADDKARPLSVLIYSTVGTGLGWLLFLVALELPISAFWR